MANMGQAASGVVGPVAADRRPAVALVGDGAFNAVCQVVATAVEYDLPAIWMVLNNGELGIERKGMECGYKRSYPWCRFIRKVALIELAEGPIMLSNVVDTDLSTLAVGQPVKVAFERIGKDLTIPVFKRA